MILMMIKINVHPDQEETIKTIFYDFSAKIINDQDNLLIIEVMANTSKNDELLKALEGISTLVAIARTGPLALAKGALKISL